jgi:tungstate transport system ATP-binding protein
MKKDMKPFTIQAQNLGKRFGDREVLSRCSVDFESGKIHALLGPNGVGKTTLLRILNLLDEPGEGTVSFNGLQESSASGASFRKEITMVFQQPALFKTTVYKNVAYGLKVRKVPKDRIEQQVGEVLELVGMSRFAGQKTKTLSAGEAQRVALARALAVRPRVLYLDEPTANLDPYNATQVEEIIREVKDRYQTTILLATHNLFQAKRLSDRIVFLYNGRVVEASDTQTFFENPKEDLSRRFVKGELV